MAAESGRPARRALFTEVNAERPRRAEFTNVTPDRPRKKPRWLSPRESTMPPPPSRAASQPRAAEAPSLKPAPVPQEFVQAVRRELRTLPNASHEIARDLAQNEALAQEMARSLRPSELPPPGFAPPGFAPPVAEARPDPGLERAFRAAIEQMAGMRSKVLEAAAHELAALAAIIARRVIARELKLAPEILEDLVREALEALSEQDRIRVRVGRGFQNAVDGLEQKLAGRGGNFRVVIEADLADYDCIVETELGQVDESVEKRLEKLLEALKPDSEVP
jgi:flagellar biosynthesis/type III secretory pathway protein FliH